MSTRAEFFQSMYPGLSNGEVIDELIKASIYGFEHGPEVVTISAAEGTHYVPYDAEMQKRLPYYGGSYDKHASQGKQSMKRLVRQNRGVTNVEIQKTGIKDFDRYAKRYHIDYSIQKDLSCKPPRYLVYFKAQDTDALSAAFKEYSASVLDKTKRPSVLAKLHDLAQSVANLPDKVRHKQEERGL